MTDREQINVEGVELDGLRFERRGATAIVTLDRPSKGNALTAAMAVGFAAIWRHVARDRDLRCVIVTGAGERHFCTGTDLGAVAATGRTVAGDGAAKDEIAWSPHHFGVDKPVICAINGLVAGGGLHFVADADLNIAAHHVELLDTHTNVGMVGAVENVGLTHRLPLGTVLRMTLWGKHYRLTAHRAWQLGLVDELCDSSALMPLALSLADQVALNSPSAVSRSREAIWSSLGRPREDAEESAWKLAKLQRSHPDFREGAAAFAERRTARWSK